MLTHSDGQVVCFTVTLLDGLVLARSGVNHSMNDRSAVVFGIGRAITDPQQTRRVLDALIDRFTSGRSTQLRRPSRNELAATTNIALPFGEASVKVRSSAPVDDPDDLAAPRWVGVIPLATIAGPPQPAAVSIPATAIALTETRPTSAEEGQP
jgi:uncharacterized protein